MPKKNDLINDVEAGFKGTMEQTGITPDLLASKLREELEYGGKKPKPVAMRIRQAGRQDAHKLRGDYAPEKVEISGELTMSDRLKAARERLKKHGGDKG